MPLAGTYRPRHPEHTAFYQCLEDYREEFQEAYPYFYEGEYGPWRPVVERSVERCLPMWDPSSRICPPALFRLPPGAVEEETLAPGPMTGQRSLPGSNQRVTAVAAFGSSQD